MKETSYFRLKFKGKISYFDCHRCFLPLDHEFRLDSDTFKKDNIVLEGQRLVNQVLGNLIHLHHPGVVTMPENGRRELTTTCSTISSLLMEATGTPRE
jgi:hypothetical protein